MRGLALLVVVGCGGTPEAPARLEEVANTPEQFQEPAAAFDTNDQFVMMDTSLGLRRLNGDRFVSISGGLQFTFGSFGLDRDGALLLASPNVQSLTRLEADDGFAPILPAPPTSFARALGTPGGAYHIVAGFETFMLPAGAATWVPGMPKLDRTLWTFDGSLFAVIDGDVVQIDAADAVVVIASCAEFGGGVCQDMELVGADDRGHIHMGIKGAQEVHILDPVSATYRHVALPGALQIESLTAGATMTVVIANDPDRQNQRSLWVLAPGSDELLRFATLPIGALGGFVKLLSDRGGNAYLLADGKLQAVVLN